MADNTIDTLDIKISSDASSAVKSLERLAGTLLKVEKKISGIGKINLEGFSGSMKQLSAATDKLNIEKVTRFVGAFDPLRELSSLSTPINNISEGLDKLSKFNFDKLSGIKKIDTENLGQIAGNFSILFSALNSIPDMSKLSEVGTAFQGFATALSKADKVSVGTTKIFTSLSQLAASANGIPVVTQTLPVLSNEIKKFVTVMAKAPLVEGGTVSLVSALSGIAGAGARATKAASALPSLTQGISNFVIAMSRMQSLNSDVVGVVQALQQFIKALSGADKVSAGTTKIFTALSQLAASANNIPIVTRTLPALSIEIGRFITAMSQAPLVEAGTISLISALSGLSGAGARVAKAASALPSLTQGISDFVTAVSRMPALNSNVVAVIQALAQFAGAGGRAGSAARGLQANIDNLSRSMSGLRGGMGKAAIGLNSFIRNAAALAGVSYGFYAVGNAIRSSIKTASQLTEVQNVIDVTFGDMRDKLEDFAKASIESLGMSELMAKQMAGRFQAMGLALGESQKPMANMSIELTRLAGDMASFYDVSQKVVGQDLEAIFTGQTKPLRKYGIDLTQATLKAWALSKGIDANFKTMTQLEKVQLRYAYVMEKSAYAQGDFARTSGTWANQTRILGQQFQELGSVIGNGLIALFLPVVKVINVLISRIIILARTLGDLLGGFFGFKMETGGGAGFNEIADNAESAAESTESAAGGIADAGKAAKKAKKDLNGFIAGWHEVNNMTSKQDSGSGGGGAGGIGDLGQIEIPNSFDVTVTATDEASPVFEKIKARWQELSSLFVSGFKIGFGDISVLDSIVQNFNNIRKSLKDIFSDEGVTSAFNNMLDTLVHNAGVKVGSFASIGATILDNITGGAAKYLETAKERIKQYLIDMFDITADTDTIITNFTTALANIFTVFRSDTAKQITADIIQIFSDGFMGVTELAAKFGRDVLDRLLTPITENTEKIKEAIDNTLKPIETVLATIANGITETFAKLNQMYDEHLKPLFDSIRDGLTEIYGNLLDGYNTHIAPVLDKLATRFSEVWDSTVQPILNNAIDLIGAVGDLIKAVWENGIQPAINWIASNIMPLVGPVLEWLGNKFFDVFEEIGQQFNGFLETAKGVVTFLTGVFSGDWEKAWNGIKDVFKGIWDGMPSLIKEPIRNIIKFINSMIGGVETGINSIVMALNKFKIDIPATPFTEAFSIDFGLSTITLPRIPALAKGGVLRKGQMGFLEGDGAEAVVPLEKNTQWISRVAEQLRNDLGQYKIDVSVPDYKNEYLKTVKPDVGSFSNTMQMEMNTKMAEYAYQTQQQNELLREQNELLRGIYNKPTLQSRDVFNVVKNEGRQYVKQFKSNPWPVMGK